jgi:hypothetical protein
MTVVELRLGTMIPEALLLLLRIALAVLGLLCFHINFRVILI